MLIKQEDILFTEPTIGSCVAYLVYGASRKLATLKFGKITEDFEDTFRISAQVRSKERIIYVLTTEAYNKIIIRETKELQANLKKY